VFIQDAYSSLNTVQNIKEGEEGGLLTLAISLMEYYPLSVLLSLSNKNLVDFISYSNIPLLTAKSGHWVMLVSKGTWIKILK
jgi:hypothetical protein